MPFVGGVTPHSSGVHIGDAARNSAGGLAGLTSYGRAYSYRENTLNDRIESHRGARNLALLATTAGGASLNEITTMPPRVQARVIGNAASLAAAGEVYPRAPIAAGSIMGFRINPTTWTGLNGVYGFVGFRYGTGNPEVVDVDVVGVIHRPDGTWAYIVHKAGGTLQATTITAPVATDMYHIWLSTGSAVLYKNGVQAVYVSANLPTGSMTAIHMAESAGSDGAVNYDMEVAAFDLNHYFI